MRLRYDALDGVGDFAHPLLHRLRPFVGHIHRFRIERADVAGGLADLLPRNGIAAVQGLVEVLIHSVEHPLQRLGSGDDGGDQVLHVVADVADQVDDHCQPRLLVQAGRFDRGGSHDREDLQHLQVIFIEVAFALVADLHHADRLSVRGLQRDRD